MIFFVRGCMFRFDSESIIYDKACIIIINPRWRAYTVDEHIIATTKSAK